MTIVATTNLSLPLITTGTEAGAWGDEVNYGLTSYLDIAIAGGLGIAITSSDITLANTAGTSTGTGIVSTGATGSSAQYVTLNITGAKTNNRNLNLPVTNSAGSAINGKWYIINNSAATGGFTLTVRGYTPPSTYTTGITMADGEKAVVAWNGSDFVKIVSSAISSSTGILPIANGGSNSSATPTAGGIGYGTGTAHAYTSAGTAGQVVVSAASSAPAFGVGAATTPSAVTFSATAMTVNCLLSNVFTTTFTANVTVAPTISNPIDGQTINWFITQDGTGSRTMTWPSSFKWQGGVVGVLSTPASSVDLLVGTYRSTTASWYVSLAKAFA